MEKVQREGEEDDPAEELDPSEAREKAFIL